MSPFEEECNVFKLVIIKAIIIINYLIAKLFLMLPEEYAMLHLSHSRKKADSDATPEHYQSYYQSYIPMTQPSTIFIKQ